MSRLKGLKCVLIEGPKVRIDYADNADSRFGRFAYAITLCDHA
ncbi:hypothetical protein AB6D20_028080 (plasmid) [Vibrio splendidus]